MEFTYFEAKPGGVTAQSVSTLEHHLRMFAETKAEVCQKFGAEDLTLAYDKRKDKHKGRYSLKLMEFKAGTQLTGDWDIVKPCQLDMGLFESATFFASPADKRVWKEAEEKLILWREPYKLSHMIECPTVIISLYDGYCSNAFARSVTQQAYDDPEFPIEGNIKDRTTEFRRAGNDRTARLHLEHMDLDGSLIIRVPNDDTNHPRVRPPYTEIISLDEALSLDRAEHAHPGKPRKRPPPAKRR